MPQWAEEKASVRLSRVALAWLPMTLCNEELDCRLLSRVMSQASLQKKSCLKLLYSGCCFKNHAIVTERKNWSPSSIVTDLVLTLFLVSFIFLNRLVTHVAVTLLVEWHQLCYHVIIHNAANKSLKMFVGEWGRRNNVYRVLTVGSLVHLCSFIF